MKKIYFMVAILAAIYQNSYSQDTTSLAGKLQYIFSQLNRSEIPTGFLEERGLPLMSIKPFNGVLTDSNKLNITRLRMSYFGLYSSCMLTTNPMLPIDTLNGRINQYLPLSSTVPVVIHLGKFNSFKPNAIADNLLTVDGDDVIHDVSPRTSGPYLTNNLFAASPIKNEYENGNFSLVFKPDLFFNNSGLTVAALYIDFDDGQGYQSTSWNIPVYPNYSIEGEKSVRIKIVLSDNSQYECYSPIKINEVNAQLRFADTPNFNISHQFYSTISHSGGWAYVRLSTLNNSGHIKKPLIVAEGYDVSDVARNIPLVKNYSYSDFIADINKVTSLGYDFNNKLDDIAGYDLIFVDYNQGTDDIVRNANLLKDVIAWVNADKIISNSTEQNVVLGISMGGLVARYALADMTKNNISTQTRLLITHDSPHHGANVPVGLQEAILNIGRANIMDYTIDKILPEYADIKLVMARPATIQLLKYRVETHVNQSFPYYNFSYYYSTIESNVWLTNVYRPMVTFQPNDPQPSYRFIATSQGSECGSPLFAAGSQLLNIQAGGAGVVLPFLGVYGKAKGSITANALPSPGTSGELVNIDISVKKYFLGIRFDKNAFKYNVTISNSAYLPIDGAAGGTSPIGEVSLPQMSIQGNQSLHFLFFSLAYSAGLNTATLNNFCFVPTASALDVQNFNYASLTSKYVGGFSPVSSPSLAQNFIANETVQGVSNEIHTRFTSRNANWLFNEMENIANNNLNCSNNCQPDFSAMSIQGGASLCPDGTYNISNLPINASVVWSSPNPDIASLTSSGNSATLTKIRPGQLNLIANINTACGSFSVSKNIQSGPDEIPIGGLITNASYGPGQSVTVAAGGNYVNASNYTWTVYGGTIVSGQGTSTITFTTNQNQSTVPLYLDINLIITTPDCGDALGEAHAFVASDGLPNPERFAIFPNPASSDLTINQVSSTKSNTKNAKSESISGTYEVKLYNSSGRILHGQKSLNGEGIGFNVQHIENGTYFLHIIQGKEVIKKQIIINH